MQPSYYNVSGARMNKRLGEYLPSSNNTVLVPRRPVTDFFELGHFFPLLVTNLKFPVNFPLTHTRILRSSVRLTTLLGGDRNTRNSDGDMTESLQR